MTRTTKTTVTFARPFFLGDSVHELPAGAYDIETDEELLAGLSFPAYRRTEIRLYVPTGAVQKGRSRTLIILPQDLDAALQRDKPL